MGDAIEEEEENTTLPVRMCQVNSKLFSILILCMQALKTIILLSIRHSKCDKCDQSKS